MPAIDTDKTNPPELETFSERHFQEQPRPISWTAILALLLGIASVLIVWSSCFLVFSLGAAFLGAAALWQTQDADPPPLGRGAAWVGMLLGLFFACSVVTYQAVNTARIEAQVDAVLKQFLKYLRSQQMAKAYELTRHPMLRTVRSDRTEADRDTNSNNDNAENRENLAKFEQKLTIDFLRSVRKLELLEAVTNQQLVERKTEFLIRGYRLRVTTSEGKTKEVQLQVTFARWVGSRRVGSWWIHDFEIPPEQMW